MGTPTPTDDDLFVIDDRVITVPLDRVPTASAYGCGAPDCQHCYPVIYRCEHGVDYPRPLINNSAARNLADEGCGHHEPSD